MGANRNESSNSTFYKVADGKIARKINKEDLPSNYNPREYRVRSGTLASGESYETYEEIYDTLSGTLTDIVFQDPPYGGRSLRITLEDGDESYVLNVDFDKGAKAGLHSNGTTLMGKMLSLDPEEWLGSEVTIVPYKIARDDDPDKYNMGVSINHEGKKIISAFAKKSNYNTTEGRLAKYLPDVVERVVRGKKTYDSSDRDEKIYEFVERFVKKFTELAGARSMNIAASRSSQGSQSTSKAAEAEDLAEITDDLPF